jgi:hypothetical protein
MGIVTDWISSLPVAAFAGILIGLILLAVFSADRSVSAGFGNRLPRGTGCRECDNPECPANRYIHGQHAK